jgi:tetratricopeptide (TPR) repeat protein
MKRAGMAVVMLGAVTLAWGQSQAPATQSPPAAAAGAAQSGTTQTAPQPKRPPQAKTQAEFDAYNAAVANAKDPAAMEKAADDFATKFPDSELRVLLYRAAMHAYQSANNGDKMLEMGRKVLAIDPDDPEALVGVAEVLVERTRDSDLDKQQRWDEAAKDAQHALQTMDTDLAIPVNTPQEKVDAYKGFLRSTVYSILGTLQFNQGKYTEAEGFFQKSIDAYPAQPDPVVVLRLALALDKQNKYADALKQADRAVDLSQANPPVLEMAKRERDRLVQLTGGIPVPETAPASPTQNANSPSTSPSPAPKN